MKLRQLDKLVGSWSVTGLEVKGKVTFAWFAGGWYLVQKGWIEIWGRKITFVEYIGYDPKRRACVSHLFDNFGDLFTYEWEVKKTAITIWFGQEDSGNCFKGRFAKDGKSYSGA